MGNKEQAGKLQTRLLLVEDDAAQSQTLAEVLQVEGYAVVACGNVADTLICLEQDSFAVMIVDLRLPDMEEQQLLQVLSPYFDKIPTVINTGFSSYESVKAALNLGVFAYVEKKGNVLELARHIHRAVEMRLHKRAQALERDLENIFNLSLDLICIMNMKRVTFTRVNPAFGRILGYGEAELLERLLLDFIHPEDVEETRALMDEAHGAGPDVLEFENRCRCKDGSYRVLNWTVHPQPELGLTYAVAHDVTERKKAEETLRESQTRLKSLASELVLAEERERNRIAIHLHDDVCQNLAYVKMKLQMVSQTLDDQAQIADLTETSNALTRLMEELRTLTFELTPPILTEFGLEAATSHWLQEQIEQEHGIDTEFIDDGQTKPLDDDVQVLLFRSVRELLANVVKHSQAKHIEVSVFREEDQILVRLEDDGVGFAPDKVVIGKNTAGFGLFSIRERLSQLGGSLEIDSRPGQGCRSLLRAPLRQ